MKGSKQKRRYFAYIGIFFICNLIAITIIAQKEYHQIHRELEEHGAKADVEVQTVMKEYLHSFQLFATMLNREIEVEPHPDQIWTYLKQIDKQMLEIEGATFDGLYMYYQGRYLYSWDTPFEQYEQTGYDATTRPWYLDAQRGAGEIVFTPPYMSYANHYILSTISQLQQDKETVFAYDIKMENIQTLVSSLQDYKDEQMLIYDENGTIIGSSVESYLGGNLTQSLAASKQVLEKAQEKFDQNREANEEEQAKMQDEISYAQSFYTFKQEAQPEYQTLLDEQEAVHFINVDHKTYVGYLHAGTNFNYMILIPIGAMLSATIQTWLVPLLILEIILIYVMSQVSKGMKNHELRSAYVELGQTQKRLEIALQAAQKAAAIDELTGMMNLKSFRSSVKQHIEEMSDQDAGILIMIDGDRFKYINDQYGHMIGDEVIKLSAQMIVGRIRTIDYASRLHGDEFAIFVCDTSDYAVAKKIMEDINHSLAKEAAKRHLPSITLSSGAVVAHQKDHYLDLIKTADNALYEAKATHNGAFHGA